MPRKPSVENAPEVFYKLYAEGKSQPEIALQFGVTQTCVSRHLRKHCGYRSISRDRDPEVSWPPERRALALSSYAGGCSVGRVARDMKTNRRYVRAVLREAGVLIRPQSEAQSGENNWAYRGGRTVISGYVYVSSPNHPNRTQAGYVAEHRLVMERALGRFLSPEEVVHHEDRDTQNNDFGNLRLFASNAEHLRYELTGRRRASPGV